MARWAQAPGPDSLTSSIITIENNTEPSQQQLPKPSGAAEVYSIHPEEDFVSLSS